RYGVAEPLELLVRLRQGLFDAAPFREIAGHLRKPDEFTVCVPHRAEHRVGPKPRAVLAHAPPLVLVSAVALRHLQLPAGLALRRFFGRIERGEVRTEDLVGAVAIDALGAVIPSRYAPVRVAPDNG